MERHTRQKQAVMQAIETSGRSLNAAEIWSLAQLEVPSLNLSTVYRQIKALHDDENIVRVDLPGQPPRYEAQCHAPRARGHEHHHHHFHCTGCEQVFPHPRLPRWHRAAGAGRLRGAEPRHHAARALRHVRRRMKTGPIAGFGGLLMAGAAARLIGAVLVIGLLWLAVGWASSTLP